MMLIIPAAGRGSRMAGEAGSPPKCLLTVGGSTLLSRLVSDLTSGITQVRIVVPPGNPHLAAWRESQPDPAALQLVEAPVEPYGHTILRAIDGAAYAVVVDSDLVTAPGELADFLRHAISNPSRTSLTVGVSRDPWSLGPRTIWWSSGRIGRDLSQASARMAGVYCLRERVLARLRDFVNTGGTSFAAFLSAHPADDVDAVEFRYAFDLNTPADLDAARRRVGDASRADTQTGTVDAIERPEAAPLR
ncbi:MAG: NTP transferase domain-containing protein [Micromonosporaceae bacterium]